MWFNFILDKSGIEIDTEECNLDKLLSLVSFDQRPAKGPDYHNLKNENIKKAYFAKQEASMEKQEILNQTKT